MATVRCLHIILRQNEEKEVEEEEETAENALFSSSLSSHGWTCLRRCSSCFSVVVVQIVAAPVLLVVEFCCGCDSVGTSGTHSATPWKLRRLSRRMFWTILLRWSLWSSGANLDYVDQLVDFPFLLRSDIS